MRRKKITGGDSRIGERIRIILFRPVFARDVATHHEEQLLEGGETPLSTSPEAEPSSILSPRNPQRLSTPSLKKVPPSRIRKHVRTLLRSVRPRLT